MPEGADPREVVREEFGDQAVAIEGGAGDLVIWHTALPHGSSPNTGTRPRVAQYITMNPAREARTDEWRKEQDNRGQQRLTGLGGNKREKEHEEGKTATLTELGRKLLGVDPW